MKDNNQTHLTDNNLVKILDLLTALLLLLIYGLCTRRYLIDWDLKQEAFLRFAVLVGLTAGAFHVAGYVWRSSDIRKSDWWNIGGKLDSPSWEDVRRMAIGETGDDPIAFFPQLDPAASAARSIAAYLILGSLFIEAVTLVVSGPIIPRLLPKQTTDTDGLSANLTALLALIAAAISIYFTYRQLQAKVKAESRQAWITKLRAHIAQYIALADAFREAANDTDQPAEWAKLKSCRLEMELMLNPSERDHRLLMHLSLRLAFFHSGERLFNEVDDVRNIKNAIGVGKDWFEEEKWAPLLGPIPPKSSARRRRDREHSDLVGYTMRLSHVVLKREWQRVKATR